MTGLAEEFSSFDRGQPSSLSAYGIARSTVRGAPLGEDDLKRTHAYWRACNYLMLGMIYLRDKPAAAGAAQAGARRSSGFISIV